MAESLLPVAGGRRLPGFRLIARAARRTVVESLYLFTAPVTAGIGLLLVFGGLCIAAGCSLLPGGSRIAAGALALVRSSAGLERWRVAKVRRWGPGAQDKRRQPASGQKPHETVSGFAPDLWLDVAHSVAVLPVILVTSITTGLWWAIGVAFVSYPVRSDPYTPGSLRPMTLYAGSGQSHIALSLGMTTPDQRLTFALTTGMLLLLTLPLLTRACVAVQAGLAQALLSDMSALYRRIHGLERERDAARAQVVAAVTAEAAALRRLERDIHDGPQQRLVRLTMELGRAQHHFDSRPEAVREALADAVVQAREALDELRALSRGIAPPILADRGLPAAVAALAARSVVPVDLDVSPLNRRLDAAVETAAYFTVAEALTNVAKHSGARRCEVAMSHGEGTLRVWVTDDGTGGAALGKGHGLRGLDDRLHAVGGRLRVASPEGGPTTITAELPCR